MLASPYTTIAADDPALPPSLRGTPASRLFNRHSGWCTIRRPIPAHHSTPLDTERRIAGPRPATGLGLRFGTFGRSGLACRRRDDQGAGANPEGIHLGALGRAA